jgi:hypothetical protein
MIPATHPYEARYRHGEGDKAYISNKPVIAWDDDGAALVADAKTGRLVEASSYSNFIRVAPTEPAVVGVIPGGDWRAEFEGGEDSGFAPVLAWLVTADGSCAPVCSDSDGSSFDPTDVGNFVRVANPVQS